jgi:hypothetical protein
MTKVQLQPVRAGVSVIRLTRNFRIAHDSPAMRTLDLRSVLIDDYFALRRLYDSIQSLKCNELSS